MSSLLPRGSRKHARVAAIALIGASAAAVLTSGVFAGLNATAHNSAAESVSDGTLKLTLTDASGSAGFTGAIANLAPGDVVNRYVTLTNAGTLDAQGLTLGIAATGTSSLITDGVSPVTTKALRVTVTSCTVLWSSTGVCGGTSNVEIAAAPLSTFGAGAQSFVKTANLAANGTEFLQVSVTLPDQNETTVDGTLPTNTVQGGSASLTYTFTEAQRTATTTNS